MNRLLILALALTGCAPCADQACEMRREHNIRALNAVSQSEPVYYPAYRPPSASFPRIGAAPTMPSGVAVPDRSIPTPITPMATPYAVQVAPAWRATPLTP